MSVLRLSVIRRRQSVGLVSQVVRSVRLTSYIGKWELSLARAQAAWLLSLSSVY